MNLCPHNQNPKACLTCFHAAAASPKAVRVPPPQSPIVERVKAASAQPQRVHVPQQTASIKPAKGAYRYEDNMGEYDSSGLWIPPVHRSLIDRQPVHPHKNETKFLK